MTKRIHALKQNFSGHVGESMVKAELLRSGFRVADPCWSNDETDLLVVIDTDFFPLVAIPIQVKTIQFFPTKEGKIPENGFVQGLKKSI